MFSQCQIPVRAFTLVVLNVADHFNDFYSFFIHVFFLSTWTPMGSFHGIKINLQSLETGLR